MARKNLDSRAPFLYPGTQLPFLLDTPELRATLPIPSRNTLAIFRDRIDTVSVGTAEPGRQPTQRHPLPYVLGLQAAIKNNRSKLPVTVASEYTLSDEAHVLIREGRDHFKKLVDSFTVDGYIYSGDATSILNMGPNTIARWSRIGVVQPGETVKGLRGDGRELFIARGALERVCEWRLPEPIRETGIQDLPYPPMLSTPEL